MLCKSTKKYIEKQARTKNIAIPSNYEDILNQFCEIAKGFGHKLEFRKGRGLSKNTLNANAGLFKNSSIVVTPEWAAQLVLCNKENISDIFKITIGHELTHKEKQLCPIKYIPKIKFIKFLSQVNEVHADFGAAKKMANGNRKQLLDSIEYKKSLKKIDKEYFGHPSWTRRKIYVENYNFNNELIQKIAKDIGYTKQNQIDKVCKYYKEIELN